MFYSIKHKNHNRILLKINAFISAICLTNNDHVICGRNMRTPYCILNTYNLFSIAHLEPAKPLVLILVIIGGMN